MKFNFIFKIKIIDLLTQDQNSYLIPVMQCHKTGRPTTYRIFNEMSESILISKKLFLLS